jgi:hypothetical protein
MPISFTTQTLTIGQLFSGDSLFQMPAFQRPYSWQEEQVLQLFDDLNSNYLNQEKELSSEFFLGPIVVTQNNSSGPTDVIDGQQRLVTIAFILATLRDLSSNQNFIKSINNFLWREGTEIWSREDIPRVSLKTIDQPRMLEWVYNNGGTRNLPEKAENESTSNLLENIRTLKNEIGSIQETYVQGLAKYILNQCYVIKIVSTDSFEAYRIFKSINTIGQPLSELDIIRGELVNPQYDHDNNARELAQIWDNIEHEIGANELENYVKIVLSTIDREYTTSPLKKVLQRILSNPNQLNDLRHKLTNFISSYDKLKTASLDYGPDSDEVNRIVKCLRQYPFDHWYSITLLWLVGEHTNRDALMFFQALDALCLGLIVLKSAQATRLKKRFSQIEDRIKNGDVLTSANSEIFLSQDEKHLIKLTLEQPIKKTEKFLKPLLLRLNVEMQNRNIPPYFPEKITLEHILPQNPKKGSCWIEKFPEKENRLNLCNNLGNFAILTGPINSKIKNAEFAEKLKGIFNKEAAEVFAITSELTRYSDWTQNTISTRNRELINIARKIFLI